MIEYDDVFHWRPRGPIHGDPIGPWVQWAFDQKVVDSAQAAELTVAQVELQKQAIDLQRQALDLQVQALDAIAQTARRAAQT